MTLPRRSFLKSIAAALAGATAIRSAVTPVAEAVEPLPPVAEFPKKGLLIHSALLEDNLVDVQHDMMARLGREWAERVDREVWLKSARRTTTLPEGWEVRHTQSEANIRGLISVDTRDYVKLARASEHFHNIAFGRSY